MSLAELEEVKDGEDSEDKEEVTGKQKQRKLILKCQKLRCNYIQLIYILYSSKCAEAFLYRDI